MTIERYSRCAHCGRKYIWCVSGKGYNHPNSPSKNYCSVCYEAIKEALAKIPRAFESRYNNVKDIPEFSWVTLEKVLEWESEFFSENSASKSWTANITRIWPGLVDVKAGEYQYIRLVRGREEASEYDFRLSTWPHRPDYSSLDFGHSTRFPAIGLSGPPKISTLFTSGL